MSPTTPGGGTRHRHPSTLAPRAEGFAHPSEALFAHLLTLYGLEWEYEPKEFALAWGPSGETTRAFRPDFYLPSSDVYIELTVSAQRLVTKKNSKIRRFRELYPDVELLVVYRRDFCELVARHDLPFGERDVA